MQPANDGNSSMLKTIFDHVIGQILRLVEKQIDEVGDGGNCVKVRSYRFINFLNGLTLINRQYCSWAASAQTDICLTSSNKLTSGPVSRFFRPMEGI